MIITVLNGGLGNQMFEYAIGRVLSLRHATELFFDISSFDNQIARDTKRQYELGVFGVPGSIASKQKLTNFSQQNKYQKLIQKYIFSHLLLRHYTCLREDGAEFHEEVLYLPNNTYLSGYWQSEKYFLRERDLICKDFSRRTTPLSQENQRCQHAMQNTESVSVHIRRGDFITNAKANAYHGICSLEYYKGAMDYIEQQIKHPTYYVFSDDPSWSRKNIHSKYEIIYIAHNHERDAHEDLRLMSKCQHNIIANSSFSWWGAWLNTNAGKIVIAPKQWYKNNQINTSDLIPSTWKRV